MPTLGRPIGGDAFTRRTSLFLCDADKSHVIGPTYSFPPSLSKGFAMLEAMLDRCALILRRKREATENRTASP